MISHDKCTIIAEIGQNHQGSMDIAKHMIIACKKAGADVVKFQKSNLKAKFNQKALDRSYPSKHSWGETYGKHKEYLEFNETQFRELQKFAQDNKITFTASGMDIPSFIFLNSIDVPFFKIGSGDTNNLELIETVAKMQKMTVLSTGMNDMESVKKSVNLFLKYNTNLCLLQCTSSYPLPDSQVNLNVIRTYHQEFGSKGVIIGYSGHETGLELSYAAVAMGAKVIERHVTLDKGQKGTDHSASLDMTELKELVDGIRRIEKGMGSCQKMMQPCEKPCFDKLGKSLVMTRNMKKGDAISIGDVTAKVAEPKGVNPNRLNDVIGMVLMKDYDMDESLVLSKKLEIV